MTLINMALDCQKRGWSIFPLVPNAKVPLTSNGFKSASRATEDVRRWWTREPKANIGIATGQKSGIVVVDVDVKKDKNGIRAKGRQSAALIKGLLPPTFTVLTPTGGWHLYYLSKNQVKSRTGLLPGIDIKAEGGYVVGPGSAINGKEYIAQDRPMVKLPDILRNQINRAAQKKAITPTTKGCFGVKADINISVGPNNWHMPMLKAVGWMVWMGFSDSEILAKAEAYTLPGWTTEQTRKEVSEMINGARRKGFDK